MTSSEKTTVYQVITDRILTLLDSGIVPWRKGWTGGRTGNLPRNIRGRAYRGINTWLLLSLGYENPYFLTYKQAAELGGKVRAGEKGMSVILWLPREYQDTDAETGKVKTKRVLTLRYYTVFNIEQTEGCKFPKTVQASLEPNEVVAVPEVVAIEAAEAILAGYKDGPIVTFDGNGRAFYVPREDSIHLPKRESFVSASAYYNTRFHEMSHSTGHESRLKRDIMNHFGSHDYGVEELTAEFSAAFLASMAGLEPDVIDNSAAYIASWKSTIKADPKLVITAAGRAQKSADYILGEQVAVEATEEQEVAA